MPFLQLDTFHAPYKRDNRYWTGILLVVRCALLLVFALNTSVSDNVNRGSFLFGGMDYWNGHAHEMLLCQHAVSRLLVVERSRDHGRRPALSALPAVNRTQVALQPGTKDKATTISFID